MSLADEVKAPPAMRTRRCSGDDMTAVNDAPVSTPLLIAGGEREGGDGTFPVEDPGRRGAVGAKISPQWIAARSG